MYKAFYQFTIRVYHSKDTARKAYIEFEEFVEEGDLFLVKGCGCLEQAMNEYRKYISLGFLCEICTADKYLNTIDTLIFYFF